MGDITTPKDAHTPAASDFAKKLQKTREKAKEALTKAIQYMKTAYDKHKNTKTQEYPKGTLVWLDTKNLIQNGPMQNSLIKELDPSWY